MTKTEMKADKTNIIDFPWKASSFPMTIGIDGSIDSDGLHFTVNELCMLSELIARTVAHRHKQGITDEQVRAANQATWVKRNGGVEP